jgi:DTW domain-containing protein YfiP
MKLTGLIFYFFWLRCTSFRILLLTHANEVHRPTNTGRLLLKHQSIGESTDSTDFFNPSCSSDVSDISDPSNPSALSKSSHQSDSSDITDLLVWQGRGDNIKISKALERISQPVLVWTEAPKVSGNTDLSLAYSNPTYIILDGTWQEAKKIFRQGPDCLRKYPRISLKPSFKSNYKLRRNFGYVNRFAPPHNAVKNGAVVRAGIGAGVSVGISDGISDSVSDDKGDIDSGSCLLCTAEVAASLLLQHGHREKADTILDKLETFQMSFESYSTTKSRSRKTIVINDIVPESLA